MDVDSAGQVHVTYTDSNSGQIHYKVRNMEGMWSESEVAIPSWDGVSGMYMDAVVDAADRFQLAYTWSTGSSTQLEYGYLNGSEWQFGEVVDDQYNSGSKEVGYYVSIDVDSNNFPSFAYMDYDVGTRHADTISDPILSLFLDVLYATSTTTMNGRSTTQPAAFWVPSATSDTSPASWWTATDMTAWPLTTAPSRKRPSSPDWIPTWTALSGLRPSHPTAGTPT